MPEQKKNKRKRRKKYKSHTSEQRKPVRPSFASIIRPDSTPDIQEISNTTEVIIVPISTTDVFREQRKLHVNYVPKKGNRASYDAWTLSYFPHIVRLRDILVNGLTSSNESLSKEWLYSFNFLDNFCQYMYEYSSGIISKNIENMDSDLEDYYYEFLIKRNE